MRIVHIITGLGDGGAEGSLYKLCIHDKKNIHSVISLTNFGKYGPLLKSNKIKVYSIDFKKDLKIFNRFLQLIGLLKKLNPDFVQTWMYHADLIGGLASKFTHNKKVIWGIRCSNLNYKYSNISTIIIIKINALLSYFIPVKIVSCSFQAKKIHIKGGYCASKFVVIPNGFDLNYLNISETMRKDFRREHLKHEDCFLIGMVARFDKQKDHKSFFKSIYEAKKKLKNIKCVLVGKNMDRSNLNILRWIEKYELKNNIILLGSRRDINLIMNGLDLHILSSAYGEGFPNVLAESMACGTPCIATKVGDSEYILGGSGWIVKPYAYKTIAEKIFIASNETKIERKKRSFLARSYIEKNFSIEKMIKNFNNLYSGINIQ